MTTDAPGEGDGSDYLEHLERESARFLESALAAPSGARVPTCPDWDADDLLWHLAEVQWFWAEVVRTRADDPGVVEAATPRRPLGREALAAFYAAASADLQAVLGQTPPQTRVWTWADEQSAGFVRRRQAHEALIHRVDAELAATARTGLDPALAADGVDEVLTVMFGGVPPWGRLTPDSDGAAVRLSTTDTGHTWLAVLGRWSGTSPNTGTSYDDTCVDVVADDGREAASLRGAAADLDCLLWNRPPLGEVVRAGDERSLALLDAVLADGIQ